MKKSAPQSRPAAGPSAEFAKWQANFERSERFAGASGYLLYFCLTTLFWGWAVFNLTYGDGPDIFLAFWFSAHVAGLIACAAVVVMNWPSRDEWRELLAPQEKLPPPTREQKAYNRVSLILGVLWFVPFGDLITHGTNALSSFPSPTLMPLWLAAGLTIMGVYAMLHLSRLDPNRSSASESPISKRRSARAAKQV